MENLECLEEIKKRYDMDNADLQDMLFDLSSIAYDNKDYGAYDFLRLLASEVEDW